MFLDRNALFSDSQNLAQAAGSYLSTYSYDTGVAGSIPLGGTPIHDVGRGNPLPVLAQIVETFTSGGAGTLQVQVVQADDGGLTSNLEVLAETPALALATLVAGYQFRLPSVPYATRRFVGLRFVIATAAMTAGKVTAGVVMDKQSNPSV